MSIEQPKIVTLNTTSPREFVHIQNLGDGYNAMCDVLPIAHFRQQQETEEFCERFNLAIERRLAEIEIGQEKNHRCSSCGKSVEPCWWVGLGSGQFCESCWDLLHPAPLSDSPKPQEPSLTVDAILTALGEARTLAVLAYPGDTHRLSAVVFTLSMVEGQLMTALKGKVSP